MKFAFFQLTIFILLVLNIEAQPKLLKDIYQFGNSSTFDYEQIVVGNNLYFIAKSDNEGNELWATDGTSANTRLVKEIYPGKYNNSDPTHLTELNGSMIFAAINDLNGRELWKTDGNEAGTTLIKDIFPGQSSSFISNEVGSFVNYQNKLYFSATESFTGGYVLYESDGTTKGTIKVENQTGKIDPHFFMVFNNKLYFGGAVDFGSDLMVFDGNTRKISLVKKINSSINGSSVSNLISAQTYFLFIAFEPTYGSEIYKSDGTAANTTLLKDLTPGSASSNISFLGALNNKVFFCNNGTLYVTDGTASGTISLNMNCAVSGVIWNNKFFFGAANPANNLGVELYLTDGTVNGTQLIKDINTGPNSSNPMNLVTTKNSLFFAATDDANGLELWQSDGTDKGTNRISDIQKGASGSNVRLLRQLNEKTIFFYANDGLSGEEPWIYEIPTVSSKSFTPFSIKLTDHLNEWKILTDEQNRYELPIFIHLYSLSGERIYSTEVNSKNQISEITIPKPFKSGIYLLQLFCKDQYISQKLVVMK